MDIGKLPESVLKRSVIKQLHVKRPEVGNGPSIGEDCATVQIGPDEEMVLSTDPITGTASDIGELAVTISVNDLASAGAEPIGILLTVLLTPRMREAKLKHIMEQVDVACKRYNVQVIGGHTEVTEAVNQPLISVTSAQ